MKRFIFTLSFICLFCSCSKLQDDYIGYTCVTIDDMIYESHKDIFKPQSPDLVLAESSFDFWYFRSLYNYNKEIRIEFKISSSEPLEIGKRYDMDFENSFVSEVAYKGKGYVSTGGWIVFNDIEFYGVNKAFLTGFFEFAASTDDGGETIDVQNGRFYRLNVDIDK